MNRSHALRFSSELDLERLRSERRERFAKGQVHVPERDVLAAVLELLARHPRVAWAKRMSSGVTHYTDRTGAERFVRFGFSGLSDIVGMLRKRPGERVGAFLALEVKSDRGAATPEQEAFMEAVSALGGCAGVVRSIDEAHRLIEEFWGRREQSA